MASSGWSGRPAIVGWKTGGAGGDSPSPAPDEEALATAIAFAGPERLLYLAEALRRGGLRPEQARVAASEQLEAMRRALDYQPTGWQPGPLVCGPDATGACATRPSSAGARSCSTTGW